MTVEMVSATLGALLLALVAWAGWCLARPPRCPRCHCRTASQPAELLARYPLVFRVGFRCPACDEIVAHHSVGTWE